MTGLVMVTKGGGCGGGVGGKGTKGTKGSELQDHQEQVQNQQLSMMAFVLTAIRKSLVACRIEDGGDDVIPTSSTLHHMDIGWPTNVQHITHVTFDRFNGFLGLPVEFEVEIPCRVPSARYLVFFIFRLFYFFFWEGDFKFFKLVKFERGFIFVGGVRDWI
jgi:hypothetical protein